MPEQAIIAFGKVDAKGKKIDGSDNWDSSRHERLTAAGVYSVQLLNNDIFPLTVILSAGDHNTENETKLGIEQSDNIFVAFDVTVNGFGVNSRDISEDNAGNQDGPFNFVVFGMK